jgi:hypothetical protein
LTCDRAPGKVGAHILSVGYWLLREAREPLLLLIFEDLHWIDGETQALLDGSPRLAEACRERGAPWRWDGRVCVQ